MKQIKRDSSKPKELKMEVKQRRVRKIIHWGHAEKFNENCCVFLFKTSSQMVHKNSKLRRQSISIYEEAVVILMPKAALTGITDQCDKRRHYGGVQLPAGAEGQLTCRRVCKKPIWGQQLWHRDLRKITTLK